MIQKLKRFVLSAATLGIVFAPALIAAPVYADTNPNTDINGSLCFGSNLVVSTSKGSTDQCQTGSGEGTLNDLLAKVINIFSAVVGVIAVLMIIVGGLRYITSGGDSGKVSAAKTTIIYALVGLVVVALAQLIVHFVLNQANAIVTGG